MNDSWQEVSKYQEAIAKKINFSSVPPITNVQDIFNLPSLIPPNFDFSTLSYENYQKIIELAKSVL